jgi:hypothetical protein
MPRLGAMTRGTRFSAAALTVLIALLFSACAPEVVTPPAETITATPRDNRDPVPSPPDDPIPSVVWPLTGLSAVGADPADVAGIALGVKVENGSMARPQSYLEYADIVFEEYINDSGVRFLAVFQTTLPDEVGPVRSARNMDPNLMGSFHTALVASGCNFEVQKVFQYAEQYLFMEDAKHSGVTKGYIWYSEGFFRVNPTISMHSLRVDLPVVADDAIAKGATPATKQFDYAYPAELATASVEGTPVGTIDIRFSGIGHPHWDWDATTGLWQRFEFSQPHLTQDGNQIAATNVIILRAAVVYSNGKNPESIVIVSGAPGFVATGGKVIPILWSKADRYDTFHLTTLDGEPVLLAPGKTWVEIVPRWGARDWATIKFDDVVQP